MCYGPATVDEDSKDVVRLTRNNTHRPAVQNIRNPQKGELEALSGSTGDSDQSLSQEARLAKPQPEQLIDSFLEDDINFLLGIDPDNMISPMSETLTNSQDGKNSADSYHHTELSPDPQLDELDQVIQRLKTREIAKLERQKRIL